MDQQPKPQSLSLVESASAGVPAVGVPASDGAPPVVPASAGTGTSPPSQTPPEGDTTVLSRRHALKYGLAAAACVSAGGAAICYLARCIGRGSTSEVFHGDAPSGRLWDLWQKQGWVREARHYRKLGRNIECRLCPNGCLLEPEDRGHCRNRVHKDGKLFTLAYSDPCAVDVDPIEKKPLYHFLPETDAFSIATAGCGFRCLNCQNWDLSQCTPEETKDAPGEPLRPNPAELRRLSRSERRHLTMLPDDVVAAARHFDCSSIAYTYSEPVAWFEYMLDTATAARAQNIKNCWITCGYINAEPLRQLCRVIDAANVNLKSFSDAVYHELNTGKLEPILNTLKMLKRENVWFEVTNLIVPTYTDKPDMIRRMCDWLVANLGPDYPLHFSRFIPRHKLTRLPPTPVAILLEAREIARSAGLHYVYIGNCAEVRDGETTHCPHCRQPVIHRERYAVLSCNLAGNNCPHCRTPIAGVWS